MSIIRILLLVSIVLTAVPSCGTARQTPQGTSTTQGTAIERGVRVRASTPHRGTPPPSAHSSAPTAVNGRPGETAPVPDPDARHRTEIGAIELALYFWKAFDWMHATNDASWLAPISAPGCKSCASYMRAFQSLHRRGEVAMGGRLRIDSYSTERNYYQVHAQWVVDVIVDEDPVILVSRQGSRRVTDAAHRVRLHVFVTWRRHRWQVAEVTAA